MKKLTIALLAAFFTLPLTAAAENFATYGEYTIHYNALSTDSLSPDVAKAYGIRRSKARGMINVAVRKKLEDGTEVPVPAKVRAESRNIHAQIDELELRQIKEEQSVYYIADFKVDDGETLRFKVDVTPEGSPLRTVEFTQTFYVK